MTMKVRQHRQIRLLEISTDREERQQRRSRRRLDALSITTTAITTRTGIHKSTAFQREASELTRLVTSLSAHGINKVSRLDHGEDYDDRHAVSKRLCAKHGENLGNEFGDG